MADIHYTIRKGVFDRLVVASNTFRTAITQTVATVAYYKLYYGIAPQKVPGTSTNVTFPMVVFTLGPIVPGRDSGSKWYSATATFNVAAETLAGCETLAGLLSDRLEDSESGLSFTGFTVLSIDRGPQVPVGLVDGVHNMSVQYSITIQ